MSKLPRIFHNNNKFNSNNKTSFNTFGKAKESKVINNTFNSNCLIDYFNKSISITLKDGSIISGILISKRGNNLLLNNGIHLKVEEIDHIN